MLVKVNRCLAYHNMIKNCNIPSDVEVNNQTLENNRPWNIDQMPWNPVCADVVAISYLHYSLYLLDILTVFIDFWRIYVKDENKYCI